MIFLFRSIVGAPVGIASESFTLIFFITRGRVKKLLDIIRNKKKKHDKILTLAKCKRNSFETLISQALNNMEISHEEFNKILKEIVKHERMKYILESENEKQKIINN